MAASSSLQDDFEEFNTSEKESVSQNLQDDFNDLSKFEVAKPTATDTHVVFAVDVRWTDPAKGWTTESVNFPLPTSEEDWKMLCELRWAEYEQIKKQLAFDIPENITWEKFFNFLHNLEDSIATGQFDRFLIRPDEPLRPIGVTENFAFAYDSNGFIHISPLRLTNVMAVEWKKTELQFKAIQTVCVGRHDIFIIVTANVVSLFQANRADGSIKKIYARVFKQAPVVMATNGRFFAYAPNCNEELGEKTGIVIVDVKSNTQISFDAGEFSVSAICFGDISTQITWARKETFETCRLENMMKGRDSKVFAVCQWPSDHQEFVHAGSYKSDAKETTRYMRMPNQFGFLQASDNNIVHLVSPVWAYQLGLEEEPVEKQSFRPFPICSRDYPISIDSTVLGPFLISLECESGIVFFRKRSDAKTMTQSDSSAGIISNIRCKLPYTGAPYKALSVYHTRICVLYPNGVLCILRPKY